MDIKVTVLMPVYNTESYIATAVSSVLDQKFKDFELLIINDGSTDRSMDIARSFNDPRVVIADQPRGGVAAALNKGLALARGEFIARFDSDDICYPNRLTEQYEFMKTHPEYVLIGSDADYIDKEGQQLFYNGSLGHSWEEIKNTIYSKCPFIHSSVFYYADIARELGGYDVKAHSFEDYMLWMKFIHKGKVLNFNKPLIAVRLNPDSLTVDEKLRGKKFINLKKEILSQQDEISPKQEQQLLSILQSQDFSAFKQYSYYILIAKKYLWNNYQPAKSRKNLRMALKQRPFSPIAFGLLFLSFLPRVFVERLYRLVKSRGNQPK